MDCPKCGKKIEDCPNCGASLSSEDLMEKIKDTHSEEYKIIEKRISQKYIEDAKEEVDRYRNELENLKVIATKDKNTLIDKEFKLRKELQELESKASMWELEKQRVLDDQRKSLTEKLESTHELQKRDLYEQMEGMKRTIAELNRKSAQGSMQTQGESQELIIGDRLQECEEFKLDIIEHIAKGISGADILQKVRSAGGTVVGSILWESKRTKDWSNNWLDKLKQDQRESGANFAILVTQTMPKGVSHCKFIDGVWVSDFQNYIYLAASLRMNLLDVYQVKSATETADSTMSLLYEYICGKEFINRVEALAEYFRTALADLDKERRALQKIWASREQLIRKAESSTVGIYVGCKSILGESIPSIGDLELVEE